mmetsp:Transcript_107416/g.231272  ORF Transcript_107416/g.231272 Transcript_107416/m.231272 type:complete len:227 (+) Transcript_107416:1325-2005(+)
MRRAPEPGFAPPAAPPSALALAFSLISRSRAAFASSRSPFRRSARSAFCRAASASSSPAGSGSSQRRVGFCAARLGLSEGGSVVVNPPRARGRVGGGSVVPLARACSAPARGRWPVPLHAQRSVPFRPQPAKRRLWRAERQSSPSSRPPPMKNASPGKKGARAQPGSGHRITSTEPCPATQAPSPQGQARRSRSPGGAQPSSRQTGVSPRVRCTLRSSARSCARPG